MSRREAWLSAGVVFLVAALVRAWAASRMPFPIPEDATYYVDAARNLVTGHGLTSDSIWSFATPARDATGALTLAFPRPAFEIWLPLASLLAAVPMSIFGPTDGAALVVPVAAGGLIAVLAWRLAADVADERGLPAERARTLALGTGLVAAVWLPLVIPGAVLDSSAPFGVAALAACLLMVRLARRPPPGPLDRRVLALGACIGLAALSRNEAIWLGLTWLLIAAWISRTGRRARPGDTPEQPDGRARPGDFGLRWVAGVVASAGLVAVAILAPWLVRNWLTFGSPLPGQAVANAWSLSGYDIFAWQDPPTLARYLAAGATTLVGDRVTAFGHNLVDVLVVPGLPVSVVGVLALPWASRLRALRPALALSVLMFAVTTLFFPVSTTWGTFLHAALPCFVLLLVAAMAGLDEGLAWVGRHRGWTNPVAWLAPVFAGVGAILFTALGVPAYGSQAAATQASYRDLGVRLAAAGVTLAPDAVVIASHPVWFASVEGVHAVALPDEPVTSVVDLARTFHARYVVVDGRHGSWPGRATTDPDAACLNPVALPERPTDPFAVYEVSCP